MGEVKRLSNCTTGGSGMSLAASGYRPVELAVTVDKNSTTLASVFLQAT
jgi:hypothetical protein